MWPFLSRALFPPPSEAWLRKASSDPEAQGWGAWSWTEKTPLGSGGGGGKEGKTGEVEGEDAEDAGILLSLLERADLAECPGPDQVTATWSAGQRLAGDLRSPRVRGRGYGRQSLYPKCERANVPLSGRGSRDAHPCTG